MVAGYTSPDHASEGYEGWCRVWGKATLEEVRQVCPGRDEKQDGGLPSRPQESYTGETEELYQLLLRQREETGTINPLTVSAAYIRFFNFY